MVINGKKLNICDEITIDQLLKNLNLNIDTVVVEINLEIVDKDDYKSKYVNNNDRVEIVNFVGGG
ncbi:sulfur carrier protein ThiS [Alkalithermobacter paradoxus]|uniref:Sulfur carrier protein ThiS n=1 Tax=Alkalithermobacter paradoxus TaxID=29349 RepID=A0A1V4I5Q7_9FIRM|nr:sulfur carrier protein ThiS [[Clostridium] thermoalcaliphilum]